MIVSTCAMELRENVRLLAETTCFAEVLVAGRTVSADSYASLQTVAVNAELAIVCTSVIMNINETVIIVRRLCIVMAGRGAGL